MEKHKLTFADRFGGLIFDRTTGRAVGSKLAAVSGHLLLSIFFVYQNYKTGFNAEQWLIYASVIAGHKTAEKLIGLKWGGNNATNSHSNKDS